MDFEDQEADDHEEPEPISMSADPFNHHHHDSKDIFPTTSVDPQAPPPQQLRPKFKECLKNHAVGIGGHAVDGCGEFMPAGEEGTLESLRCAACGCHRNFHRKETTVPLGGPYPPGHLHGAPPLHHQQLLLTAGGHRGHFGYRSPSGYLHVAAPQPQRAAAPLALPSSSGGGDEMGEEIYYSTPPGSSGSGKKRFRTKFSQEQKDKMLQLALRLDWKIQKQDEEMVQSFCEEYGIKRHVLKVWMHNNKNTLGKKT